MKRTFKGKRGNFTLASNNESFNVDCIVMRIDGTGHEEPIELRLNEVNHSPTGHNWGYGGSGPAQLAYCLLRECGLTQPQAAAIYQDFKRDVVSTFDQDKGFEITKDAIMKWVAARPRTTASAKA